MTAIDNYILAQPIGTANWRYCNACGYMHESSTAGCPHDATTYSSAPRQAVQPFACPVCQGHKTVQRSPTIAGDQLQWVASGTELHPCPACNATGIVWGPPNG